MSWNEHPYDEIPGTYVFDGKTAHSSFGINKLLFSFNRHENRTAFANNSKEYAEKYNLSEDQKTALCENDFLQLLRLGANIYYLAKLAVPQGFTMQDTGAAFQGITTQEFQSKLDEKANGLKEKLHKEGGFWHG